MSDRPAFLVTIDAEGDDLWSGPRTPTTQNARFLPRFQALCERFALKPTYLTDWEMCHCPAFRELAGDAVARGRAEVGMHLHPANTPPAFALDGNHARLPCLVDYPPAVMGDKIARMTEALGEAFGLRPVSHRAGRWIVNGVYASLLADAGYQVDCSITPHVAWPGNAGFSGSVEADYRGCPEHAYFADLSDPRRPAEAGGPRCSSLLEVPMTVLAGRRGPIARTMCRAIDWCDFGRRVANRLWPDVVWLRPLGRFPDRRRLLGLLNAAERDGRDYVMFMLHSSELMPAGSPTFITAAAIDRLYDDLECIFERARERFVGMTLKEYRDRFVQSREPAV